MAFIAYKTDDGGITGKISFYCRLLHVNHCRKVGREKYKKAADGKRAGLWFDMGGSIMDVWMMVIIPSLIEGLIPAVIVGIFIWQFHRVIEYKANKKSAFELRIAKKEDEFFEHISKGKQAFHHQLEAMEYKDSDNEVVIIAANRDFLVHMQQALRLCEFEPVALGGYREYIKELVDEYKKMNGDWLQARSLSNENGFNEEEHQKIYKNHIESIRRIFYDIDILYYGIKSTAM